MQTDVSRPGVRLDILRCKNPVKREHTPHVPEMLVGRVKGVQNTFGIPPVLQLAKEFS